MMNFKKITFCGIAALLTVMTVEARDSKFTRHGAGPLYWMAYEHCFVTDQPLPESRYKNSVDWVAENFLPYGFDMVCTDGWIEQAQTIDANGYITKYNDGWVHDFSYWIDYNKKKGLKTGIYYDPLWMTRTAYDKNLPIKGSDKRTRDIKGNTNFNDFIYWVDTDKEGAEQWVKGYVRYFIELGFSFLRIDFLNWFEDSYGTDRYVKALRWIKEEAGDEIFVSLVMPNCFDHAANEIPYGDLFRISEDVFGGGWDFISNRRRGVQQDRWAQWGNVFDGFVGFSDVAARGQIIMDGDFIRLNTCADDNERQFWVSLMAITGSPIAIADQYDTANGCERFYQNEEILALNKAGFSARPASTNPSDVASSRWFGQLPDGDWIVGLFNREESASNMSVNFVKDLGITDGKVDNVRDLWSHSDLGAFEGSYRVNVPAHGCRILRITAPDKCFQAEVAGLRGGVTIQK